MLTVEQNQDDIYFPVAERPVYLPTKAGTFEKTGHKAIIRGDRGKLETLAIVKDSYKLVTNREVMDALQPILASFDTKIHTYFDKGGAKSYIDVQFEGVSKGFGGSPINFRTIFWNGYGGASFGAKVGAINFFCLNGAIWGEYEGSYRRHTSGLDASIAAQWVEGGLKKWDVVTEKWQVWLETQVDHGYIGPTFAQMSDNETHQERMLNTFTTKYVPQYGRTQFSVYQTLTDFASHYEDYRLRAVNSNSPHERELRLLAKAEQIMQRIAA